MDLSTGDVERRRTFRWRRWKICVCLGPTSDWAPPPLGAVIRRHPLVVFVFETLPLTTTRDNVRYRNEPLDDGRLRSRFLVTLAYIAHSGRKMSNPYYYGGMGIPYGMNMGMGGSYPVTCSILINRLRWLRLRYGRVRNGRLSLRDDDHVPVPVFRLLRLWLLILRRSVMIRRDMYDISDYSLQFIRKDLLQPLRPRLDRPIALSLDRSWHWQHARLRCQLESQDTKGLTRVYHGNGTTDGHEYLCTGVRD